MATIQETVADVRKKYTHDRDLGPTASQCAAICNEAAWIHRAEGWGLSTKTSGSYGILSDGSYVAADIIQHKVTLEHFDCLVGAGWDEDENRYGPATPAWQPQGVLNDPARPWKAPINPGTTTPPPDPLPPPTGDLEARVADLETRVLRIETKMQQAGAVLSSV
jgi:hypothetical protein